MNFLDKMSPSLNQAEGNALAQIFRLSDWTVDSLGLKRLHRLAEINNFHPDVVNQKLDPSIRGLYQQALYNSLDAVAIQLEDIKGEKDI